MDVPTHRKCATQPSRKAALIAINVPRKLNDR